MLINKTCKTCEFNFDGVCAGEGIYDYGEKIVDSSEECDGWGISLEYFSEVIDNMPWYIKEPYNRGKIYFGEALQKLEENVSGRDRVLVMGLGPVGQAAIILAKAMGAQTIGVDLSEERMEMARKIGADLVLKGDDDVIANVLAATDGKGVEVAIDCSGSSVGRHRCLEAARMWGNVVFLGEQGTVTFEPSPLLLHKNLTLHGSWVTSVGNMEKLVELLDRKKIHPSQIITHRFPLRETDKAFALFATGKTGKVCVCHEME